MSAPHNLADPLLLDGLVVVIDVALLDVIVAIAHVLDLVQHNRSALADSLRWELAPRCCFAAFASMSTPGNFADPVPLDGLVVVTMVALLDVVMAVAQVLALALHSRSALADII
jgi:hypothetical protein